MIHSWKKKEKWGYFLKNEGGRQCIRHQSNIKIMKKHLNRILLQAKGGKQSSISLFPFFISHFFQCVLFFLSRPPSINATRLLTDEGGFQKRVWNGYYSNRGATASTGELADANQFWVATWRYACRLTSSVGGGLELSFPILPLLQLVPQSILLYRIC